jgi:hypothetical protein
MGRIKSKHPNGTPSLPQRQDTPQDPSQPPRPLQILPPSQPLPPSQSPRPSQSAENTLADSRSHTSLPARHGTIPTWTSRRNQAVQSASGGDGLSSRETQRGSTARRAREVRPAVNEGDRSQQPAINSPQRPAAEPTPTAGSVREPSPREPGVERGPFNWFRRDSDDEELSIVIQNHFYLAERVRSKKSFDSFVCNLVEEHNEAMPQGYPHMMIRHPSTMRTPQNQFNFENLRTHGKWLICPEIHEDPVGRPPIMSVHTLGSYKYCKATSISSSLEGPHHLLTTFCLRGA